MVLTDGFVALVFSKDRFCGLRLADREAFLRGLDGLFVSSSVELGTIRTDKDVFRTLGTVRATGNSVSGS